MEAAAGFRSPSLLAAIQAVAYGTRHIIEVMNAKDFLLNEKVAIITGAGSGYWQGDCPAFAARAARVALLGRSESVRETARALGEDRARHFILDVTDFPRIQSTIAMPEEVAAAALFLASDGADMITGANLLVDGGYTIH